jgi:hypothetical protein
MNIKMIGEAIYIRVVPSTAQIRAEGNNTKCVGKKRFNGSVTHGLRKEHVLRPPFLDKVRSFFFLSFITILPSESGVTLDYSTIFP